MKISYRTNPIIKFIEENNGFRVAEHDRYLISYNLVNSIKNFISVNQKDLLSNINIMSESFVNAFDSSYDKLYDSMLEHKLTVSPATGVLIFKTRTYIYSIKCNEEFTDTSIGLLVFDNEVLTLYSYSRKSKDKVEFVTQDDRNFENVSTKDIISEFITTLLLNLWFIKHCPIELKVLGAGKRLKEVNCKYANDTKSNVKILDSTWFTTLVKSEGFKVRGHFRLQPCGDGMKDRRLIWINDFEKTGYERHFKRPVNIEDIINS